MMNGYDDGFKKIIFAAVKFVAAILAFIVLTLTVQPAFSFFETKQLTECSTDCCANEDEQPVEDEKPGDPCSDFCNPFLKCGGCAASTIEFLAFSIQQQDPPHTIHILLAQRLNSQFAPDFWQPPKLA